MPGQCKGLLSKRTEGGGGGRERESEREEVREIDLKQMKKLQKRSRLDLTSYPRFFSVTSLSSLFTLIKKAFAEVRELSFFPSLY